MKKCKFSSKFQMTIAKVRYRLILMAQSCITSVNFINQLSFLCADSLSSVFLVGLSKEGKEGLFSKSSVEMGELKAVAQRLLSGCLAVA